MKRNMLFIFLMLIFCGCTKDTVGEVSNIESSAVAETTEESTTEMQITEPTKQPPSTEIKYPEETKVSDDELNALKHVISEFFARRADEEMEKLWQSGEWNPQTLEDLKTAHFRTPYK